MNEIRKENDMFTTTLFNPESTTKDLIGNGLNTSNTQLLTPEQYKETPLVKKYFTDENGVFNEPLFNQVYAEAYKKYDSMDAVATYDDLNEDIVYGKKSIFRKPNSKTENTQFTLQRVKNPFEKSFGIVSLYGEGPSNKSAREIAQSSRIYDTKTGKWLDESAEDRGFFGTLFSEPLVYATYDKSDWYINPETGQKEWHEEGEWKLNPEGTFYTETLGDRDINNKQFVALSDVLTKEDSWINQYDFFDSDGRNKSVFGTIMKVTAQTLPYVIPTVGAYWGAVTAAMNMGATLPTFYKMLEDIARGEDEDRSEAFKAANQIEAFFKKFDNSYSDDAMKSNFDLEKMGSIVSDVFGQIYQMRAAAKLSTIIKNTDLTAEQAKSISTYMQKNQNKILNAIASGSVKDQNEFIQKVMTASPEWQKIAKAQSELSKSLSLGYMALTSSSDVYYDAINGGYSPRAAGLAALAATLGQYGIMMNNELGTWFLDKTVGYNEKVNRKIIKDVVNPLIEQAKEASEKIAVEETKKEGINIFAKLVTSVKKGLNKTQDLIKYGGAESILGNAAIEGIEEVTEEAVMDATKGIFDTLSYLGFAGMEGSFGGFKNVFSKQGFERYITSAIGGFVGGALFKANEQYIEPYMLNQKIDPQTKQDIIHLVANNQTDLAIKTVLDLCSHDSAMTDTVINIGNTNVAGNNEQGRSQSSVVADTVINYIKYLDSIINGKEFGVTDEELVDKVIREQSVVQMVKDAEIDQFILQDYNKLLEDFSKKQSEYNQVLGEPESKDEAKELDRQTRIKTKKKNLNEAEKKLQAFLDGENGEYYIKAATAYLSIRPYFSLLDKYSYAKAVYGRDFNSLNETGDWSKKRIEEEFNNFLKGKNPRKEIEKIVKLYDWFSEQFSKGILDYADSDYAANYRKIAERGGNEIFSNMITRFAKELNIEKRKGNRQFINDLIKNSPGLQGINLSDLIQIDEETIQENIIDKLDDKTNNFIENLQSLHDKLNPEGDEKIKDLLIKDIAYNLSIIPIYEYDDSMLSKIVSNSLQGIAINIYDTLVYKNNLNPENYEEIITLLENLLGLESGSINRDFKKDQLINIILASQRVQGLSDFDYNNVFKNPILKINLPVLAIEKYINNPDTKVIDNELYNSIKHSLYRELFEMFTAQKIVSMFNDYYERTNSFDEEDGSEVTEEGNNENGFYLFDSSKINIFVSNLKDKIIDAINNNQDVIQTITNVFCDDTIGIAKCLDENKIREKAIEYLKKQDGQSDIEEKLQRGDEEAIKLLNETKEAWTNEQLEYLSDETIQTVLQEKGLETNQIVKLYQKLSSDIRDKSKSLSLHPLYDVIRKVNLVLSGDNVSTNLFSLLEEEETKIRNAGSLTEYVDDGFNLERIRNMIGVIKVVKGLVVGMQSGEDDSLFGINRQLNYYNKKYGDGSKQYVEISVKMGAKIAKDLDVLEQKLIFLQQILLGNEKSIEEEDRLAGENFRKLVIKGLSTLIEIKQDNGDPLLISKNEYDKIVSDANFSDQEKEYKIWEVIYKNSQSFIGGDKQKAKRVIKNIAEKYFDADYLSKPQQSEGINSDKTTITNDDMFGYILSILSLNPYEFSKKFADLYSKRITIEKENVKVPFFSQQLAIRYALGFFEQNRNSKNTESNKINLYNVATEVINKDFKAEENDTITQYGIFFCNGISGAGKTSVVLKDALDIIRLEYPDIEIIASAPGERQVDTLKKSISSNSNENLKGYTKIKLLDYLFGPDKRVKIQNLIDSLSDKNKANDYSQYIKIKNGVPILLNNSSVDELLDNPELGKGQKVIVIDEVTHYNTVELQLIARIAQKNNIVLFTGGDSIQLGAKMAIDSKDNLQHHNIDDFRCFTTPKLRTSVRITTAIKFTNNKTLFDICKNIESIIQQTGSLNSDSEEKIASLLNNRILIKYLQDDQNNVFEGEKVLDIVNQRAEYIKTLKRILAAHRKLIKDEKHKNSKIGILTTIENGQIRSRELQDALQSAGYEEGVDYVLYDQRYDSAKAVQGAEENFFIVEDVDWSNENIEFTRQLYTYSSRSFIGTLIGMPTDIQSKFNIESIASDFNSRYSTPTPQKAKELLENAIEFHEKQHKGSGYGYKPYNYFKHDLSELTDKEQISIFEEQDKNPNITNFEEKPQPLKDNLNVDEDSDEKVREMSSLKGLTQSHLMTYGFHVNLSINTELESTDLSGLVNNTPLNLDCFFSEKYFKDRQIKDRKPYIEGFTQFKQLLLNYDLTDSENRTKLQNIINNNLELKTYLEVLFNNQSIDTILNLIKDIQKQPYVIAERYNKERNQNKAALDANEQDNEQELLLTLAYKVPISNDPDDYIYVSVASLPRKTVIDTLNNDELKSNYNSIYNDARRKLGQEDPSKYKYVVYQVKNHNTEIEQKNDIVKGFNEANKHIIFLTGSQLRPIYRNQGGQKVESTVTLDEMLKYMHLNVGAAWLITGNQSLENDIQTFDIIHFFVKNNIGVNPSLSTEQKYEQLINTYVKTKDGKQILTIKGKYLFRFDALKGSDNGNNFSRYQIFDVKPEKAIDIIEKIKSQFSPNKLDEITLFGSHLISPYSIIELMSTVLFKSNTEKTHRQNLLEAWEKQFKKDHEGIYTYNEFFARLKEIDYDNIETKEKLHKEIYNVFYNAGVSMYTRKIGIHFILKAIQKKGLFYSLIQDSDDSRKSQLFSDNLSKELRDLDIYASYQLSTNKSDLSAQNGLIPFSSWDPNYAKNNKENAKYIREHLITNRQFETPIVLINPQDIDLVTEVKSKYYEEGSIKAIDMLQETNKAEGFTAIKSNSQVNFEGATIGITYVSDKKQYKITQITEQNDIPYFTVKETTDIQGGSYTGSESSNISIGDFILKVIKGEIQITDNQGQSSLQHIGKIYNIYDITNKKVDSYIVIGATKNNKYLLLNIKTGEIVTQDKTDQISKSFVKLEQETKDIVNGKYENGKLYIDNGKIYVYIDRTGDKFYDITGEKFVKELTKPKKLGLNDLIKKDENFKNIINEKFKISKEQVEIKTAESPRKVVTVQKFITPEEKPDNSVEDNKPSNVDNDLDSDDLDFSEDNTDIVDFESEPEEQPRVDEQPKPEETQQMPEEQPKPEETQPKPEQVILIKEYEDYLSLISEDPNVGNHRKALEALQRITNKDYTDPIFKYVKRGNKYVLISDAKSHITEEYDGQFEEIQKILTNKTC